eukprot:CAMPEP_0119106348 /NCGR_PEP_ID=MMETSP1180-20130426/4064_1 /TAXON_ID=3052 ORGANISM="Chlamydomonas cf sp, Strain CCMP681" /NCGR_SAMPLE_ID=MMETSP1180 /ASSEMBLY_ACC=CAM_ASM_000741 /LENGTH=143 /DNA_ID=CAMNT_0007091665 /DNA_START=13 /DNA_END=444 /DNA_ORIENTATION=-
MACSSVACHSCLSTVNHARSRHRPMGTGNQPAPNVQLHRPHNWLAAPCRLHSRQDILGQHVVAQAVAMDVMPAWTLDQIAGMVFGGVMLASVLSARQVDLFFARAQRRQLGLCEECGGIYDPATCAQGKCPSRTGGNAADQQK